MVRDVDHFQLLLYLKEDSNIEDRRKYNLYSPYKMDQ